MMFGAPLTRQVEAPKLANLLRIGGDGPFDGRVRAARLAFLSRYLLLNLLVALCNTAVVLVVVAPGLSRLHLVAWALPQLVVLPLWAWRAFQDKRGRLGLAATAGRVRRLLLEMLLVGSAWGYLFASTLPGASHQLALVIIAMALAGITITAQSTLIFPLGTAMLSGPIILGAGIGLLQADTGVTIVLVYLTFVIVTVHGVILGSRHYHIRLLAEEQLTAQSEVVRLLLSEFEANGEEWLFEFDADGILTFATTRMAEALDREAETLAGLHWRAIIDPLTAPDLALMVERSMPFRDLLVPVGVDGEERWWQVSATPKFNSSGRMCGYRGIGCDVTDRHRSAERIAELATFDALTGLVNRRVIHQTLAEALAGGQEVALLFVDLDRFKAVNDGLGHGAGDRLLAEVALRLRDVVMEQAGARGLAGRLGGDEFAVVLRTPEAGEALGLGGKIITALSEPYRIGSKEAVIGASVGMACGPAHGATVEALMRAADLALYGVKAGGRGTVRPFDQSMQEQSEDRRSLELDLRSAMAGGQMRMAFQPVVDALDERIVGFEALMRWRHPERGEVSPAQFIPMAEESGLIVQLGRMALEEACRAAAQWPPHVKLAVNLSPMQFEDQDFVGEVQRILHRWRIPPARLELELTESLFLDEREQTTAMLRQLVEMGVGIALDDFGTGYSSLGYLQKIAFSRIKIDRSFVQASASDGGELTAIIQAIVALADRLGMATTAEGTETRAEFEEMRRLGCAQVQGYYFGRPMSAEDARRLLDRTRPLVELADTAAVIPAASQPTAAVIPAAVPPTAAADGWQWRSAAGRSSRLSLTVPPAPRAG